MRSWSSGSMSARRWRRSRRMVNIGGTVIAGEDDPLELNPLTAQLLRA